jgi:hypothetical protein
MYSHHIYLKQKRRGECTRQRRDRERDRERESVCEGARIAANRGSVSCKNDCWKNRPFGISQDKNRQIYFNCGKVF